jgi:hypothetical protein
MGRIEVETGLVNWNEAEGIEEADNELEVRNWVRAWETVRTHVINE